MIVKPSYDDHSTVLTLTSSITLLLPNLYFLQYRETIVELLLQQGADPNVLSTMGYVRMWMILNNNRGCLFHLLDDLFPSYAPLHYAAERGHVLCIKALLHGPLKADVGLLSVPDKLTALHCAARQGHLACVRCLVTHGSPIRSEDTAGRSPLAWVPQSLGSARRAPFSTGTFLLVWGNPLPTLDGPCWASTLCVLTSFAMRASRAIGFVG